MTGAPERRAGTRPGRDGDDGREGEYRRESEAAIESGAAPARGRGRRSRF